MEQNLFPDVVGQEAAKKQLEFYLKGYHASKTLQTLFFAGCKGAGKSLIARETAKQLYLYDEKGQVVLKEDGITPKKKKFIEVNASTIKSLSSFVNSVFIPHIVDKEVTLFLDEIHGLKKDITNFLLTILNPNPHNRNSFTLDDYTVDIDFTRQTFLLASSEPHLVFPPLVDRTTPIQLASYSCPDLAKILQKSAPEICFCDNVLDDVAPTLRASARCAVKMADNVRTYLCGRKAFGKRDWAELKSALSILPYGINNVELSLLRIMRSNLNGSSLTNLAAKTGLSREAIMREYESHIQRLNFMRIEAGKGRTITAAGLEFLKSVELVTI